MYYLFLHRDFHHVIYCIHHILTHPDLHLLSMNLRIVHCHECRYFFLSLLVHLIDLFFLGFYYKNHLIFFYLIYDEQSFVPKDSTFSVIISQLCINIAMRKHLQDYIFFFIIHYFVMHHYYL